MDTTMKVVLLVSLMMSVAAHPTGHKTRPLHKSTAQYISTNLEVDFEVVDNIRKDADGFVEVRVTFYNSGPKPIVSKVWQIYLYSLYGLKEETADCGLRLRHQNGGLHYLSPTRTFPGIAPWGHLTCTLHNYNWLVSRTDNFPNWYVAAPGVDPLVIQSTAGEGLEYVRPFATPNQWKRSRNDTYNPFSARERYDRNNVRDLKGSWSNVIPTPSFSRIDLASNMAFRRSEWTVSDSADFPKEAAFLADMLHLRRTSGAQHRRVIHFVKSTFRLARPEEYLLQIMVDFEVIEIEAFESKGAFYGVQTLISLIQEHGDTLPNTYIKDTPRFPYRGIMIDVVRNFRTTREIMTFLNAMSVYKLNRLHLHLSDDEGWRLQIPGLPELTEIGGRRCHNPSAGSCNLPSLGSGPDASTSGTGHYSVAEYRQILQYAQDRHVTVIPEIDMPGHFRSAVLAMEHRDKQMRETTNSSDKYYTLTDHHSNIHSIQNWTDNTLNPCLDASYRFIEHVIDEIVSMHRGIQPLEVFHMGGDEITHGVWNKSPSCIRLFPNFNTRKMTAVVHEYFIKRVAMILEKRHLSVEACGDSMINSLGQPYPKQAITSRDVIAVPWNNIWEEGKGKEAYQLANAGYKVVLGMATHLYFDIAQEPDPEERGLYWATRYTDTKRVFGFQPNDVFANADVTLNGVPINTTQLCERPDACPKLQQPENIIGIQAFIWSELIRTDEQFHYMGFPRILALAERAWHQAPWESVLDKEQRTRMMDEDWERFANTLGHKELPRLEKLGIRHRVAPPGAIVENGVLKVNVPFPGSTIERFSTTDNSWHTVSDQTPLPDGHHSISLRSRSSILHRASRIVSLDANVTSAARENWRLPSFQAMFNLMCLIEADCFQGFEQGL